MGKCPPNAPKHPPMPHNGFIPNETTLKANSKTRTWMIQFYSRTGKDPIIFRSYENMKEYVSEHKREVFAVYESEWKYMNTKLRKTDEVFSGLGYY